MLHIGKTGGTAVKAALRPVAKSGPFDLALHKHRFTLAMVPEGEPFFFALRDPVERFVSGFASRQREGRPRYVIPWSERERQVFERFPTANALALSLSAADPAERDAAESAMTTLEHLGSVLNWFGDEETLLERRSSLLKVLFTDSLDQDFADLVDKLGLGTFHPELPRDAVGSHRAPTRHPPLEPGAVANLQHWYERDYRFLELCRHLEAGRGRSPVDPEPIDRPGA